MTVMILSGCANNAPKQDTDKSANTQTMPQTQDKSGEQKPTSKLLTKTQRTI